MYYITIDCGTTNSRVYVVKEDGTVIGKASKKVGVKDTSITGTKNTLVQGLKETIVQAVEYAGVAKEEIRAVLSSGMITSEIGLCELPHLTAPCGIKELASHLELVEELNLYEEKPVYFVRGIKNKRGTKEENPFSMVGQLDFMRGEETQAVGIMEKKKVPLPTMIVVLSSHTKLIPIDGSGQILGSLSTMSGQTYEAVKNNTFLRKSLEGEKSESPGDDYFDETIVENAIAWIHKVGLVRSFMFPRFLDVLLDTKWYERRLFFEALVAAEDMLSLGQLDMLIDELPDHMILVGIPGRCRLYQYILNRTYPAVEISAITQTSEIDSLSIHGILSIAKKAGIAK